MISHQQLQAWEAEEAMWRARVARLHQEITDLKAAANKVRADERDTCVLIVWDVRDHGTGTSGGGALDADDALRAVVEAIQARGK